MAAGQFFGGVFAEVAGCRGSRVLGWPGVGIAGCWGGVFQTYRRQPVPNMRKVSNVKSRPSPPLNSWMNFAGIRNVLPKHFSRVGVVNIC